MKSNSVSQWAARWMSSRMRLAILSGVASLALVACGVSPSTGGSSTLMSTAPPNPDPRVGLRAGRTDAGEAYWNMRLTAQRPSPPPFDEAFNSDLAFLGNWVIQGNYNGFVVWDVSDPARPTLRKSFVCPASQSDVSVFRNLLFISGEGTGGRLDCGTEPPQEPVSHDRLRGIRIFDISNIDEPEYIANVQTCRGSHTHSLLVDPDDQENVYIYVSGSGAVRPAEELPGCSALSPDEDPNSSLFRIEVIRVPLAAPQTAAIASSPRVFSGLEAAQRRGQQNQPANAAPAARRPGPNQCHDITTYPEAGYAGGACQGYGILLDISNPVEPRRLYAAADTNFATWHSVTFSNDGTKVLFTDEWGGGTGPRCRVGDSPIWGGNAIFNIVGERLEFQSYYKMPAAQTETENCVAHNGSLVPVPGRDIKVQGWYQGGVSVFDWTDPRNPVEIAFFDRGPFVADTLRTAGSWSAYWYNGYIYSSEIARGLDVLELLPSGHLTQNELDAANTARLDYFNVQQQQTFVWPPSFALARAYLDQLERGNGLAADRISGARDELARAERLSGQQRNEALTRLASQMTAAAQGAGDPEKVRTLASALTDLAM